MAQETSFFQPIRRFGTSVVPLAPWALVLGGLLFAGTLLLSNPASVLAGLLLGGVLFALGFAGVTLPKVFSSSRRVDLGPFLDTDETPCIATDRDGQITYYNPAADLAYGLAPRLTMAAAVGDMFANPAAVFFRLQNRASVTGAAREDIVTRRTHMRVSVVRTRDGQFLWRLEDLFEKAPVLRGGEGISLPMLTVSKTGTILFMNEALRSLIGGRAKTLDRVFTRLPVENGKLAMLSAEDGPMRVLVMRRDGSTGRAEIYCMPAGDIAAPGEALQISVLPVPLVRLDCDGCVLQANAQAPRVLGGDIPAGTFLADLMEGLGRSVSDWIGDIVNGRAAPRPEVLKVKHPDREIYLQVALTRIDTSDGPGLLAVLHDATELKTLEAQFVQSQKMQAIGKLAGGVAHDFNNLLTAISGHCDLLLLRHDEGDPEFADLVQIHQNANRAASLVGQLLAFSRKQNLQPEVLDLRDTLADLTHLLNRLVGERISLSLCQDPKLFAIRADKRQLEQVLMNLVVNARDAMPGGGEIRIETEALALEDALERDQVRVPPGDYAVVRVADEGVGISPDKLPKIFEPFYTTKRTGEGTGLGLSTAYGIVKQTGGFIFVDSAPGQGTVFSLYFPAHLASDIQTPEAPLPLAKAGARGDGVVLLVEDEAPVRAFASRALRLRGYTVIEAENAEEALEKLKDLSLKVDVFVTDVVMPGLDGPTWVAEALKDRPDVRVVFVSGYAQDALSEQRARIPNATFLPKPFSLNELAATVQAQIH
ncbi:MAG: ATP-binding protein [Pseudomonadota bacterium]